MLKLTNIDTFHRQVTGLSLIIGPLLLFVGVLIQPSLGADSASALEATAQHPGRMLTTILLFTLSVVVLIPGLFGLMRLLQDRGAVLGQIGGALSVLGCVCLAIYHTGHAFMIAMAHESAERPQMVALLDRVNEGPYAIVVVLLMMLGLGIGPLVLLAGVYRAGLAPTWAVAIAAISNVMTWTTGNELIIAASNGLFAIGFGVIGLAVLKMADTEAVSVHTSPRLDLDEVSKTRALQG